MEECHCFLKFHFHVLNDIYSNSAFSFCMDKFDKMNRVDSCCLCFTDLQYGDKTDTSTDGEVMP